jgi:hypothetical protein
VRSSQKSLCYPRSCRCGHASLATIPLVHSVGKKPQCWSMAALSLSFDAIVFPLATECVLRMADVGVDPALENCCCMKPAVDGRPTGVPFKRRGCFCHAPGVQVFVGLLRRNPREPCTFTALAKPTIAVAAPNLVEARSRAGPKLFFCHVVL